jgi:hypothetical protein
VAESERYVTWNIDLTRTTFKQSFQQAIGTYGDRLRAVVAAFVVFKQANGPQPWPHATADKASGFDPTNGRIRYKRTRITTSGTAIVICKVLIH